MPNLSFVISTRNRLDFLKITLGKLISVLEEDEEIVVVDGNSNDGTGPYLEDLFKEGKIHQLLIETDKNQAHGWNKAMMMAKGILIKKIIDDDVFCFEAIRKCKDKLLASPEIDFCISNAFSVSLSNPQQIEFNSRLKPFVEWKDGLKKSFSCSDVYLMVRKSALAYSGLYNTQFVMLDWEFALRISYLRCNIVYYTGFMAMSVDTPSNITSSTSEEILAKEGKIGALLYEYEGDGKEVSLWSKTKIMAGKMLKKNSKANLSLIKTADLNLASIYASLYQELDKKEATSNGIFH